MQYSIVYTYHNLLYAFTCLWIFRLLPYLGYCKQHCNKHWGACILLNHICTEVELLVYMIALFLVP